MKAEDLVIVSVDDHVVEPPHLFEHHAPAQYRDRAPRLIELPNGAHRWLFQDRVLPLGHVGPVVGFKDGVEIGLEDLGEYSLDSLRPGCWDIHERIRDMDVNGQWASLCFPQMARFAGQVFTEAPDKELSGIMVRAYNDWQLDEWAAAYPGRIIPLAMLPMWDAQLMAAEVRRLAAKGCHAVMFSAGPFKLGLPSLHTDFWDPFWAVCADNATVVCMHLGSDSSKLGTSPDAPLNVQATLSPLSTLFAAVDLIWSHVMRRFPVKIALAEGGIGWMPWFLERIDHSLRSQGFTNQDFGGRHPSDVFREHVIACFIDDPHGVRSRHEIGIESICIEVDYPHSDSSWPRTPELVASQLKELPDHEVDLITHLNAMRHFTFDPFVATQRHLCTAGALRTRAASFSTTA